MRTTTAIALALAVLAPVAHGQTRLTQADLAQVVGALTDPAKLATLDGKRAATPRLRKVMYWLHYAGREGMEPQAVLDAAQVANRSAGTERAKLLRDSLLRNLVILDRLGCLDVDGFSKLRTCKS